METNNIYQLTERYRQNIDWLNQVLKGGELDTIEIEGVTKPSISKEIADRWSGIAAMVHGRAAYQTKNDMLVSGMPPDDRPLAEVWNDPNQDHNGLYGYIKTVGWTKSPYDNLTEFTRRVATGRWQISSPHPDNPDPAVYKLDFDSVGAGSNMVLTVSWKTMRVLDGLKNVVRKVADQAPVQIPHDYCLYLDTRQAYTDDGSNNGQQGYQVSQGNIAGLGDSFVSGDNLLLIGNYYGIMIGLLATDFNLAKTGSLLGRNDLKGPVIPRLGEAEKALSGVKAKVIELDNPMLAFDVPGFDAMSGIELDDRGSLLSFYDRFGFFNFESPFLSVPGFAPGKAVPAMQVTDEAGGVIQEIDAYGGVSSPGSRLWPMPYVMANELRCVGEAGDQVVAEVSAGKVLNSVPFDYRSIRAVVTDPGLHATTQVSGAPGVGALVPDDHRILHICVVYGQSLSVGAQGVPLVSTRNPWPEDCWMFAGTPEMDIRLGLATLSNELSVFDPATVTGFQPLVAKNGQGSGTRGETVGEALAYELSRVANRIPAPWKSLWIAPGLGGSSYEKLMKDTQPYLNLMTAVARAKELAASVGMQAVVDFVYLVHGEADAANPDYYDNLLQWQRDVDEDIKAITGQARTVPFFMNQPSSFTGATHAVKAILKAHETSEHHFLVSPNYPYPYSPDIVHLAGPGYHLVSETAAAAFIQQNWPGKGWDCLRMIRAQRSGTTVTVSWSVPVPPLAIDTLQVTERDAKGFRYRVDGDFVGIESVSVTAPDTVVIELQALPAGGSEVLEYAMNGHSGQRFEYTIPRGNIRDSAGDQRKSRFDHRRLDNWAVHQEIEVMEV